MSIMFAFNPSNSGSLNNTLLFVTRIVFGVNNDPPGKVLDCSAIIRILSPSASIDFISSSISVSVIFVLLIYRYCFILLGNIKQTGLKLQMVSYSLAQLRGTEKIQGTIRRLRGF